MTPETQSPLWGRGRWVRPTDAQASDTAITWTRSTSVDSLDLEGLLDAYCDLASAQPEEMADFVSRYGVPELPDTELEEHFVETLRGGTLSVRRLRDHARAMAAARRVAAALVTNRRTGAVEDWKAIVNDLDPRPGFRTGLRDDLGDWKLERERFAEVLSDLLEYAGVGVTADWLGRRGLAIEPIANTFLGALALLLAREVGAEGAYVCDSCGARVYRQRPPRSGERVYCDRVECKREQQRRNQAKWRANKRAEGGK